LSQDERIELADLRHAGLSIRQIACRLGRAPSTISRELRRNATTTGGYRPFDAHRHATARRARHHWRRLQDVRDGERRAGIGGRRWTSPSGERLFGQADPDGVFGVHGAPRWKQRALYDAMKDAAAAVGQVRLARISIYDTVEDVVLNDVLYGRAHVSANAIVELVNQRTS
jgi:hypothetical protein